MKALTLTQPWAQLVVRGIKRFETRSWAYQPWTRDVFKHDELDALWITEPTQFRLDNGQLVDGHTLIRPRPIPLAIHAAKGQDYDAREFADYLVRSGVLETARLPRGAVVGTAMYVGCHYSYPETRAELAPSELELELGDWSDGRLLWELADPVEFDVPVPARGHLGLWEWQPAVEIAA